MEVDHIPTHCTVPCNDDMRYIVRPVVGYGDECMVTLFENLKLQSDIYMHTTHIPLQASPYSSAPGRYRDGWNLRGG